MEYFTQTVVQQRVKDFFIHAIENSRLAHAYIFYSPYGAGKEAFAIELAKALNCTSDTIRPCGECASCRKISALGHPDIKYIFPLKKDTKIEKVIKLIKKKAQNPYAVLSQSGHLNIPIEMMRTLKDEAKYAPYEARKRVFIISGAEYLAGPAANSFLKLLEEPPDSLMLILISDKLDSLLDTIRSRCQPVYFPNFSDDEIIEIIKKYEKVDDTISAKIAVAQNDIEKVFELLYSDTATELELVYNYLRSLAKGNFLEVSNIVDEMLAKRDKNYTLELLNHILLWFKDAVHYLLLNDSRTIVNKDYMEQIVKFADYYNEVDFPRIIEYIEQAQQDISRNGNPSMAFFNLAIRIRKELLKSAHQKKEII